MYNNLLERVPRGLPRRAKTLMLLHNSIAEIGRNDLSLLYTLQELNLSYNKLTSPKLHREAFRKLRVLETLDLSGNSLHSLPLGLPRSLQTLELKNNQLNSIPDGALTGMTKLQKLILSNNQLKLNSVYQGAWMELSALTVSINEVRWFISCSITSAILTSCLLFPLNQSWLQPAWCSRYPLASLPISTSRFTFRETSKSKCVYGCSLSLEASGKPIWKATYPDA